FAQHQVTDAGHRIDVGVDSRVELPPRHASIDAGRYEFFVSLRTVSRRKANSTDSEASPNPAGLVALRHRGVADPRRDSR
ncbi:MAG TPA: hypothetical protein PLF81_25480, partial [Candidatus Anammoximicrobium sp.]|nr:hypothetical protein [Candidatus Anammoximicrobium sp.]